MDKALTVSALTDAAGISKSYASEILSGKRAPGNRMAIDIFRATGRRFGNLVGATDADIAALDRVTPQRAARAEGVAA